MATEARRPQIVNVKNYLHLARDQGLTTIDAVEELIDNSIDAGATVVEVRVQKKGKNFRISVEDDGHGIPLTIRDDNGEEWEGIGFCLSLGGRGPKLNPRSIGKFGAGLTNAACCQSLRTDVYTKTTLDAGTRYNSLDLMKMEQTGDLTFPATGIQEPPATLAPSWSNHKTGTLIVFEEVDNPDYKQESTMIEKLQEHIAMVYYRFIKSKRRIIVGGKELLPYDPLFMTKGGWDTYDPADLRPTEPLPDAVPLVTEPIIDDAIEIEDGFGRKHPVRVQLVEVDIRAVRSNPKYSQKFMKEHKLNEENQGFYVVRNNRVIALSHTLGLFTRNADYNYMRGIIDFPPELDKAFGVQVTKGRFHPKDSVFSSLESVVRKELSRIPKRTRTVIEEVKGRIEAEKSSQGTSPAEEVAQSAGPLLKSPKKVDLKQVSEQAAVIAEKKKEIASIEANPALSGKEKMDRVRPIQIEVAKASVPLTVQFKVLGSGCFYEPVTHGHQVRVNINMGHPFFTIYERATQKPEHKALLDLLLMSAANAETQYDNDETLQALEQFRREWSNSLAILLRKGEETLFLPAPEPLEDNAAAKSQTKSVEQSGPKNGTK